MFHRSRFGAICSVSGWYVSSLQREQQAGVKGKMKEGIAILKLLELDRTFFFLCNGRSMTGTTKASTPVYAVVRVAQAARSM